MIINEKSFHNDLYTLPVTCDKKIVFLKASIKFSSYRFFWSVAVDNRQIMKIIIVRFNCYFSCYLYSTKYIR